jgi:uncharacterized coiled-coil protein SlyX
MQIWKSLVCLGLVMTLSVTGAADEKKTAQKGKRTPAPTQRFVNGMELTADQKEKVAALDKELTPEFQKIQKTRGEILTETQKTAEREAQKSAKASGKPPAETRKAVDEALKLTDEQKTKLSELQKIQQAFTAKAIDGLKKILTAEQQEKLPKVAAKGKGKNKKKTE